MDKKFRTKKIYSSIKGLGFNPSDGSNPGDAIRASLIAYWTFNELAGNTRLDSTANNIDLSESADGTPPPNAPIASVVGKIDNAVKILDNTISQDILSNTLVSITVPDVITFFGWFNVNAFGGVGQSFSSFTLMTSTFEVVIPTYVVRRVNGTMFFAAGTSNSGELANITANTYYFCIVEITLAGAIINVYLNNQALTSPTLPSDTYNGVIADSPFTQVQLGFANYVLDTDYMIFDEWGIVSRVLTSDERSYLWNSGNGITLYP
jgi:hypothetical protein